MTNGAEADDVRRRFNDSVRGLRGRRLTAVDYWDVYNYGPDPAVWDYGDWHHAVMGVQLGTDLGPVTVTWTSTFYPYGVEVFHEPIEHHVVVDEHGPQRIGPNLEGDSPWAPLLGSQISDTAVHWEQLRIGPSYRSDGRIVGAAYEVDVPVALRLDFDAGPVWYVAGSAGFTDGRRADGRVPSARLMHGACRPRPGSGGG
ncbi:hypothetical protein [Dactylosporangium sp. CA-139066]|uniref:hypothetical protein n=1 Tax=Dactylosporangium sp. CA-139066 TaxID=3239930 RepID=UPI003D92D975